MQVIINHNLYLINKYSKKNNNLNNKQISILHLKKKKKKNLYQYIIKMDNQYLSNNIFLKTITNKHIKIYPLLLRTIEPKYWIR